MDGPGAARLSQTHKKGFSMLALTQRELLDRHLRSLMACRYDQLTPGDTHRDARVREVQAELAAGRHRPDPDAVAGAILDRMD